MASALHIRPILHIIPVLLLQSLSNSTDNPPLTYLAIGDSYTIGESVPANERWPVQLVKMLEADGLSISQPQIIATTGWTTADLNSGIDAAKPIGPFDLVSLLIGVNNQYRGLSLAEYRIQFRGLLNRAIILAGSNSDHVFVVSIPDWGVTPFAEGRDRAKIAKELDEFNAVGREECEKKEVAFIDLTELQRTAANDASLIAADGLHPSGTMYSLWAERIHDRIKTMFKH